jgi:hypothetical protein
LIRDQRSPRSTLTAIVNPSILLLGSGQKLRVLLSRGTLIEPLAIHLHGVRLIEISSGWRLGLIRFVSRFCKVRLPDEYEFAAVRVDTVKKPSPVLADEMVIGLVGDASRLIQLTGTEYRSLSEMNGRTLHKWIIERFCLDVTGVRSLPMGRRRAA